MLEDDGESDQSPDESDSADDTQPKPRHQQQRRGGIPIEDIPFKQTLTFGDADVDKFMLVDMEARRLKTGEATEDWPKDQGNPDFKSESHF